jgi:putative glutamine amidotransferase
MQALNTASGGSSVNLAGHGPDGEGGSTYHRVYITPGSRLATIVGSGGFVRVNSQHRAGVKEAQKSPDLMASAYSLEDGVIEALESPEHPWIIGVQFHPERRLELPPHFGKLFEALVAQSRGVSVHKK